MTVSPRRALAPVADSFNQAGGIAYRLTPREALAQLAVTSCFHNTFYASGGDQTAQILAMAAQVEPEFLAKVAVYARERGFMKDAPALLLGLLSGMLSSAARAEQAARRAVRPGEAARYRADVQRLSGLLREAFPRVVDGPKMLRAYVRAVRGGSTGRSSLGSAPRKLVSEWLQARSPEQLFRASIGGDPSLSDVVALAHPTPRDREEAAIYGYLLGRGTARFAEEEFPVLDGVPEAIRCFELFRRNLSGRLPRGVPYEMLEGLPLSKEQWMELALQSSWQQTRQHLSMFGRKGVFSSAEVVGKLAEKLADREQIRRARAMPYQLLVAYLNATMPEKIREALHEATEIATENVPVLAGKVAIFPDISGSMHSPVTGVQTNAQSGRIESHTSGVQCIDVASLVAAAVLRRNPEALVVPFSDHALSKFRLDPRNTILANAEILRRLPSGGTDCAAPLREIQRIGFVPDLVWYVSDSESWIDERPAALRGTGTETAALWQSTLRRNPRARLVCMDLCPNTTTQAPSEASVLNVGGFSDAVFEVVAAFVAGVAGSWVEMIENSFDSLSAKEGPGRLSSLHTDRVSLALKLGSHREVLANLRGGSSGLYCRTRHPLCRYRIGRSVDAARVYTTKPIMYKDHKL